MPKLTEMCPDFKGDGVVLDHEGSNEKDFTTRSRPLGGFEQFMYNAHRLGCGLIYMIADLREGSPFLKDTSLMEEALRATVSHHPNLHASISSDGKQLMFQPVNKLPPSFFSVPLISGSSAVDVIQEELLTTPIARGERHSPFWQLVLVQNAKDGKESQSLVALAHHSIMDGESMVLFLNEIIVRTNELLRTRSGVTTHVADEAKSPLELSKLSFLPSQDELFDKVLPPTAGDGARGALSYLWRRITWFLRRPTVPASEGTTRDISHRRNNILSAQIKGSALTLLLRRCHAEHTTVTAALAAATLLELKRLMPESPRVNLKLETMVNLRRALCQVDQARYKDALQCFAAPIDTVVTVQENDDLWAHARAYKERLNESMAVGQWKRQVAAFRTFEYGVYGALARMAVTPEIQGRVKAAAISNLGVLSFDSVEDGKGKIGAEEEDPRQNVEGLRIARLQWGISLHGIGQYAFVAASTQDSSLNLTLTCASPIVSAGRAKRLLDGIVAHLTQL